MLAHDYGEIKHDRIWRVAEEHIPEMILLLEPLVPGGLALSTEASQPNEG